MNKNKVVKFSKKSIVAVASLVLCVCLTGVTALAATGKLQGFFKDIMRWDGAVIGTEYEQATDEIELHIAEVTDELIVEVNMINPDVAPYSAFELFGIESYKIIDLNGKEIVEGDTTEMVGIHNGKANIHVSLENISNGEYKIVVSEFVGSAKADQPLVLSGEWECEFEK